MNFKNDALEVLVKKEFELLTTKKHLKFERQRCLYIQKTFGYKLGKAITTNLSVKGLFIMPFAIFLQCINYLKLRKEIVYPSRNINPARLYRKARSNVHKMLKEAMIHINHEKFSDLTFIEKKTTKTIPADSQTNAESLRKNAPVQPKKNAIFQAAQEAKEHGYEVAIAFAETHCTKQSKYALELLKANSVLGDEKQWLTHFNNYLQKFKILPIQFLPDGISLFDRITCFTHYTIEDGPLITVIMAVYNAEQTIVKAATSILDQTWKNLELIIVDDCSDDNSWNLITQLAQSDSRIKTIRNTINAGPFASKNRALQLAEGDYITGHDGDDWSHPQRFERHINEMLANPELKASVAYSLRVTKQGEITRFSKIGGFSDDGATRLAFVSCMFETPFFCKYLGHWDTVRFGADSEMIERAKLILKDKFTEVPVFSMLCLDAESNLTNDPVNGIDRIHGLSESRLDYRQNFLKWHDRISLHNTYLDFPQLERKFEAPESAIVEYKTLEILLAGKCGKQTQNTPVKHSNTVIDQLPLINTQSLEELGALTKYKKVRFNYKTEHFTYQCLFQNQPGDYLFVLFHGAKDRTLYHPPYFERWSWANVYPGPVLHFSDPSLDMDNDLRLAWFAGNSHEYPLQIIAEIIEVLALSLEIDNNHIVTYGSSAGGFCSIAIAQFLSDPISIAINPQTNALLYHQSHVNDMLRICLKGLTRESAIQKFGNRLDMISNYKRKQHNRLLLVQNTADHFHYENHYSPLAKACRIPLEGGTSMNGSSAGILFHSKNGHGPEPRNMVHEILTNSFLLKSSFGGENNHGKSVL